MLFFYGLFQIVMWLAFWTTHKHQSLPDWLTLLYLAGAAGAVWQLISLAQKRTSNVAEVGFMVAGVVNLVLVTFALLYYSAGTGKNFTHPLSHDDAFYFAVGTLSTAGTGNIVATSDTARSLQTWEMLVGMGLVLFGVSAAVARIMSADK